MSTQQSSQQTIGSWLDRSTVGLLWGLVLAVFVFSLVNLAVYFLMPVDGSVVWVRQGPIRIEAVARPQAAGLQPGDVVRQLQGQPLDWWLSHPRQAITRVVQRVEQPQPTTRLTLERAGETKTVVVPLTTSPAGPAGSQFFTHLLVGYAFLIAGMIILIWSNSQFQERLAALVMILLALVEQNEILLVLGVEWAWSMLWLFIPLRLLTRWFAYSGSLHFSLLFPQPKSFLRRWPYLPGLIHLLNPVVTLAIMVSVSGNLQVRHAAAYTISKDIYIVYLILTCLFLIHSYYTSRDMVAKIQLRWIAWGAVMAIVPNLLLVDLPIVVVGYRLLPAELSSLLLAFVPISFTVAVLRYRLWDIDLVIRISLLYGLLTIILGAVYLLLVSLLIGLIGTSTAGDNTLAIFFVAALVVTLIFAPIRQYLQDWLDRLFFRGKLDYSRLMTRLSRDLATSLLLDDLLHLLTHTIPEQLNLKGARVLLDVAPPSDTEEYRALKRGRLVWLQDVVGPVKLRPAPLDQLKEAGLWACTPLLSGEELVGLYGLGPKHSGDFYNRQEVTLLETLARQAGVALENARLHQKLARQVRIERDLEIARQIQTSLLPAQDPRFAGLEIVGFSRPAHEVGGDFYHYFTFDRQRLGIAIGDVSGKGMPAALFMAVSLSTLRGQVDHHQRSPAQLLSTMNRLLYPQMTVSEVNTAMLYTLLEKPTPNSSALRLRVSNAGLIWPLLCRPHQPIKYIRASGLPIGVATRVSYHTCSIDLQPGDLLLLCSDGIIEAMNDRQEMFGFSRLEQALLSGSRFQSAQRVIDTLRQALHRFVDGAEPHDDMTMVVIRVL